MMRADSMSAHVLRLCRVRLEPAARTALPAENRVLFLLEGALTVDGRALAVDSAWHGAGACATVAGPAGATVLRYELVKKDARTPGRPLLARDIALDANGAYLMRCDRVEFELGAEARPHRHRGGGIRYLLHGTLELRIEGERDRVIEAGEAWFESGREPVYARASSIAPTSFIRCSILPLEIRGKSSIIYVDPADATSKPRTYTVLVDEPIEVPR
jgi:redox-sensitive bicupin YhaK (pirin superfamily)